MKFTPQKSACRFTLVKNFLSASLINRYIHRHVTYIRSVILSLGPVLGTLLDTKVKLKFHHPGLYSLIEWMNHAAYHILELLSVHVKMLKSIKTII